MNVTDFERITGQVVKPDAVNNASYTGEGARIDLDSDETFEVQGDLVSGEDITPNPRVKNVPVHGRASWTHITDE